MDALQVVFRLAEEDPGAKYSLDLWLRIWLGQGRGRWSLRPDRAYHCEVVFRAPCGWSFKECWWARMSFRSNLPCCPGRVHTVALSICECDSYQVRMVLDRNFSSGGYSAATMPVSPDELAAVLTYCKEYTRKWNRVVFEEAKRHAPDQRYRLRELDPSFCHPEVRSLLTNPKAKPRKLRQSSWCDGARMVCVDLGMCLTSCARPPTGAYNSMGMVWNFICPACCHRGVRHGHHGPPPMGAMFCSEMAVVILCMTRHARLFEGRDPCMLSPGQLHEVIGCAPYSDGCMEPV